MKAARIRIGRVTLKNGGADVRVLRTDAPSAVLTAMREWVDACANNQAGVPDGFAAVAFRVIEDSPEAPAFRCGWRSTNHALPVWLLPEMVRQALLVDMHCGIAERNILPKLGYDVDG